MRIEYKNVLLRDMVESDVCGNGIGADALCRKTRFYRVSPQYRSARD